MDDGKGNFLSLVLGIVEVEYFSEYGIEFVENVSL